MSDLERLDEALEQFEAAKANYRKRDWTMGSMIPTLADAARAYRDLLANGAEPDYAAGLNLLLAKWWEDESDLAVFTNAVDAAIGDRLLVDYPKEAE